MAGDNAVPVKDSPVLQAVLAHLSGDAARFAEIVFAGSALEGADDLEPSAIAADVRDCMVFIADKPANRHKLRLRPSADGRVTLVEILNDDMPFLVDSVVGEIQARGHIIKVVVHPLFKTQRNEAGTLQSILGAADHLWADGRQESLIAIYLEPMTPEAANDLGLALSDILGEVRLAVADWPTMVQRVEQAVVDLQRAPVSPQSRSAATDQLRWLLDGHFTFLGVNALRFAPDGTLQPVDGAALGLLRNPALQVLRRGGREIAIARESGAADNGPLIVSKASAMARVHRRVHMDYIALNTYGDSATPTGEIRIVGLLTSKAYTQTARDIPALRSKIDSVLSESGYPPQSHAGKALVNVLDTFPRDELFQIGTGDLAIWAQGILDLDLRPRVRVFARSDRFGRFVSVLLYAPRDRWTTNVRERIGVLLATACDGHITAFHPHFFDGPLLRAQFIVATPTGLSPTLDLLAIERSVTEIMRTWDDRFGDAVAEVGSDEQRRASQYRTAFPLSYTETFPPARAIEDIRRIERLVDGNEPSTIDVFREPGAPGARVNVAIARVGDPIRLSERVPLLENLGFSVIDERSYRIALPAAKGPSVALHHMQLETADGAPLELDGADLRIEEAYRAAARGDADNDLFNRLVIAAGADWRDAALMRAYGAFLRQLNAPFGLRYLSETLLRHAGVTRDLIELFHVRFDPDRQRKEGEEATIRARVLASLATIPSADEDRILRHFLNLIETSLRTNFYQRDDKGAPTALIAIKFDSKAIDAAPQPRPHREIWVYSPRVEGVHLRFAPIARGGIRWSDRAQDFRTEVLGLVKAQLVKNAVIVPSGAKGGFLPKLIPRGGSRDEIAKEGLAAYKLFIGALLSITDNIVEGTLVPPPRVVRHDGDDPYLVVAADKGTATFSDTANELSRLKQHWLGDAFASGGSVGYDHKKMAITARGAWECVKRHFRELGIDCQTTPFRVVGVGDMSGDVFGNGMLLSSAIQLVGAFDHRDIFIDPTPDPLTSIAERKRLFDLPRSSWQDYDKSKLSAGGLIVSRAAKTVTLTPQVKALLKFSADSATPAEIMRAILRCDSDLLWLGGIGTYVRATTETDEQAGDRSNDAIRVTAAELGAKVVGEGANLGLTQRARVELAQLGGKLNTDFIDNSAGVNSSDLEVNIKIALGRVTQAGLLVGDARTAFLAAMTDNVARACLVNNHQQSLALSLAEARSQIDTRANAALMRKLEKRRLLDRRLEALPNDTDLLARSRAGKPLTRPELAVLLSYSKIALTDDLLASTVPDSAASQPLLKAYMPPKLHDTYAADVTGHRLKREIIATAITNALINRAGAAFVASLADSSGRTTADIATAYLAANRSFGLDELCQRIDALDGKAIGRVQNELYLEVQSVLRSTLTDLLRDGRVLAEFETVTAAHALAHAAIQKAGPGLLPAPLLTAIEATTTGLKAKGLPIDLAADLARMPLLAETPAIVRLAADSRTTPDEAVRAFFAIGTDLDLAALKAKAATLATDDEFEALAIGQALQQMNAAQASFARGALLAAAQGPAEQDRWHQVFRDRTGATRVLLTEIGASDQITVSRLVVAATRLRDVADAMAA